MAAEETPSMMAQSIIHRLSKTTTRFIFKSSVTTNLVSKDPNMSGSQLSRLLQATRQIKELG
jgi:hypothetical protein